MNNATTSVEEFDAFIRKGQTEREADEINFPVKTLAWLALTPFFSLNLAKIGFPINDTKTGKGEQVTNLFEELEHTEWIVKESDSDADEDIIYVMPQTQKMRVIDHIVKEKYKNQGLGLEYLQKETVNISSFIIKNLSRSEVKPSFVLERWLKLAQCADNLEKLSNYFTSQVDEILTEAIEAKLTSAPEALRWIETFIPFVEIFGSQLEVALTRARRQYEIFNRRAYDRRYLDNYLVRSEQDAAFLRLLEFPDEKNTPWALHYVGRGGMGKTMLMRHINAQLATEKKLAVARVDFDYLNPDYPARQPALLLLSFAVELSSYSGGSTGFQRVEKNAREWHRQLALEKTDKVVDVFKDDNLQGLIYNFVSELERLKDDMRPLLILDTCEELAKLRPDGSLPESVRVTFEILEMIHNLMPRIRVIFSGRRPLAREGFNWSLSENIGKDSPLSCLPVRDYLLLHEIRGFNEEEAQRFLAKYKNGSVSPKLFGAILKLSVMEEKNSMPLFAFNKLNEDFSSADGSPSIKNDEIRYNPFDLDIFAAWTADKPDFNEQKLREGVHFYIKERIIERVDPNLKKILPEIALLGRFDKAMIREIYSTDNPNQFDRIFDELISQEWIDTERSVSSFSGDETSGSDRKYSPTIWRIHENMRARLLAFYREEEADNLKSANKRIAQFLEKITLERDWHYLSIAYFESTVQPLTRLNKERAADWWAKVEAKLAKVARWDWAYSLTNQLLVDEGVAGRKDESLGYDRKTENPLRLAILATHAAALTHLRKPDVLSVWVEISEKLEHYPISNGRNLLKSRVKLGIPCAELRHGENDPGMAADFITEIKNELALINQNDQRTFVKSPQLFASAIAAIEQAIETGERLQKENAGLLENEELIFALNELSKFVVKMLNPDHSMPLLESVEQAEEQLIPLELRSFLSSLSGRLALLVKDWDNAEKFFTQSLQQIYEPRFSDEKNNFSPIWLDWFSPENFESRIGLEYIRGMSPYFRTPGEIQREVSLNYDGKIDSDKETSALLSLISYEIVPWSDVINNNLNFSESLEIYQNIKPETNIVNAHNDFPPFFVLMMENRALKGQLSSTVAQGRELTQSVVTPIDSRAQNDFDKTLARLAFWFKLQDERSYNFGEKLKDSRNLDDVKLCAMLSAISNNPMEMSNNWFERQKDEPLLMAANAYHLYRAGQIDKNPLDFNVSIGAINSLFRKSKSNKVKEIISEYISELKPNFFRAAFFFAQAEFEIQNENRDRISAGKEKELRKFIGELEKIKDYVGVFRLEVILANLTDNILPMDTAAKIGRRRAAWIMLEEGILLSLRRPKAAFAILRRTAFLMTEFRDIIGEMICNLSLGLLQVKFNNRPELKESLSNLRKNYQELCEVENDLPSWSAISGCINDALDGDSMNNIQGFLNYQSKNLCWRPTLVRIMYCLAWDATSDVKNTAITSLQEWIKSNYGRGRENETILPADFDFKRNLTEAKTTEKSLSEIEFVILSDRSGDLNSPLTTAIEFSIKTDSMLPDASSITAVTIPMSPVFTTAEYETQSRILPPEIYSLLREEISRSNKNSPVLKISFLNSSAVAAPWEAIFAFSASINPEEFLSQLMFRRTIESTYTPHTGIIESPAEIISYVAEDRYLIDMVYNGWAKSAADKRFDFNVHTAYESELPYSNTAYLLHLVGVPIENQRSVGLEIISTDFGSVDVSFNTRNINQKSAMIAAVSLNELFPRLRVVVVQSPPRFEEVRTRTDRFETARLRRFCSEVFEAGVGAVIMLPPLNKELSVECLEHLARLFSSQDRIQVEDIMQTIRKIREIIVESRYSNKIDAIELSYDVCLYLHDNFEWNVV